MSTPSLSAVSLETINLYADAAKAIVGAYRVGSTRALQGFEGRLSGGLNAETVQISESLKSSLLAAEQQIASLVQGSVEAAAAAAERAIEAATTVATNGVNGAAAAGAQLQSSLPGNTAEALVTLQMPSAQLSRDVAARIAEAAQQLAERVTAGEPVVSAEDLAPRSVPATSKRARATAKN